MDDTVRPWGFYENLAEGDNHKVKRITVYPGKRLSLQRHMKRSEHWFIVQGNALVTRGESLKQLTAGEYIDISRGDNHRVENTGRDNLVFVEIQTGTYFGEDDIIRIEDDYGRVGGNEKL